MERSVEIEALRDYARVSVQVLKYVKKDFLTLKERNFENDFLPSKETSLENLYKKHVQILTGEIKKTLGDLLETRNKTVDNRFVMDNLSRHTEQSEDDLCASQTPDSVLSSSTAHVDIIKKFYDPLMQYLTRTVEIGNMMLSRNQLTPQEHEQVFQSNNQYTVNENLLKLILVKPTEVYDCFVEALKTYSQTHLYQLLHTSEYKLDMDPSKCIRSHYIYLIEEINVESMLLDYLWANDAISSLEKEDIKSKEGSFRQKQKLLSLIAMKPADIYERFLQALDLSGHSHVRKRLTDNSTTVTEDSKENNTGKSLVAESLRIINIAPVTTMCPDNFINKQKILYLSEKISQLDKKSLTIVSAKILTLKIKNGRYQEDPFLMQLLMGASEFVRLQNLQKLEEKKVTELQQMNQRLETDKEKMNKCLTENIQSLETLKKILEISESQQKQKEHEFDEVGKKIKHLTKENQDLTENVQELKNKIEILNREVMQTFILKEDHKVKWDETEKFDLNKELDVAKNRMKEPRNEVDTLKKELNEMKMDQDAVKKRRIANTKLIIHQKMQQIFFSPL